MQAYSDPERENDPHALPDLEIFKITKADAGWQEEPDGPTNPLKPGWYWWTCLPGCLPDSEPNGPYATEREALEDAQDWE